MQPTFVQEEAESRERSSLLVDANKKLKRGLAMRNPVYAYEIIDKLYGKINGIDKRKEEFVKGLPPNTRVCICWYTDCCDPKVGQYEAVMTEYGIMCKFCNNMYYAHPDHSIAWIPCRTRSQVKKIATAGEIIRDPVTGEVLDVKRTGVVQLVDNYTDPRSGMLICAPIGQHYSLPVEEPVAPKKTCWYYNTSEGCRNTDCPFEHVDTAPTSTAPTSTAPVSAKVCSYYNSEEGCRNGSKCKFLHVDTAPTTTASSTAPSYAPHSTSHSAPHSAPRVKICSYYKSEQGCRNGSKCKFLHQ